jgi:hypothetical protein
MGVKAPNTIVACSVTPPQASESAPNLPQIIYMPTKLVHYLEYAENNLSVSHAMSYEWPLHGKGFGPNILHLVKTEELMELGITCGNAMHLKQGAQAWWSGPEAQTLSKHKTVNQLTGKTTDEDDKRYRFNKCWSDGSGVASYFCCVMQPEDPDAPPCDYSWWFFCPVLQQMQEPPANHIPKFAADQGFDEDGFLV